MLEPFPNETTLQAAWEQLGVGAPTIIACAMLCSKAMVDGPQADAELSPEAETILWAAKEKGVLELKGAPTAYSGAARMLAVCVECRDESSLVFRSVENSQLTAAYLEGFRQLCRHGLILHHLFRDFSLSQPGFARAETIDAAKAQKYLLSLERGRSGSSG